MPIVPLSIEVFKLPISACQKDAKHTYHSFSCRSFIMGASVKSAGLLAAATAVSASVIDLPVVIQNTYVSAKSM